MDEFHLSLSRKKISTKKKLYSITDCHGEERGLICISPKSKPVHFMQSPRGLWSYYEPHITNEFTFKYLLLGPYKPVFVVKINSYNCKTSHIKEEDKEIR